jgi:hypothetical protein
MGRPPSRAAHREHPCGLPRTGKEGRGAQDLERILVEDSDYPNVREELAKLSA